MGSRGVSFFSDDSFAKWPQSASNKSKVADRQTDRHTDKHYITHHFSFEVSNNKMVRKTTPFCNLSTGVQTVQTILEKYFSHPAFIKIE